MPFKHQAAPVVPESEQLRPDLGRRHLTMIALGGVIGAGLFVGSGAVIHVTGPVAVLSYMLSGALIVLVMRMLGEMAAAQPRLGSFVEFGRTSLGDWAGFTIGWLYWYFWVIVVAFEAVAGAGVLERWLHAPLWLVALILTIAMTLTNLRSVRSYGEFEFWFASIKVAAIVSFLVLGSAYVLGAWPDKGLSFANLTAHGGFAPHGFGVILSGIVVVIFSMTGAEIVTIAAGESADPERTVVSATRSVVSRILLFYVGSIVLLITILPWNDNKLGESPYVAALSHMGLPWVPDVMNLVVLTAVLSCLNSGLYSASRVLHALSRSGDAPAGLQTLSRRGVPQRTTLISAAVASIGVIVAFISPDSVFLFLLNSSGAMALFVYLLVAFSQLRMRRRLEREAPERLRVKMWAFPYLTYVAIVGMTVVIVSMYFYDSSRSQFVLGLLTVAVVLGAYAIRAVRARSRRRLIDATPEPARANA
jgi:GABA permease